MVKCNQLTPLPFKALRFIQPYGKELTTELCFGLNANARRRLTFDTLAAAFERLDVHIDVTFAPPLIFRQVTTGVKTTINSRNTSVQLTSTKAKQSLQVLIFISVR